MTLPPWEWLSADAGVVAVVTAALVRLLTGKARAKEAAAQQTARELAAKLDATQLERERLAAKASSPETLAGIAAQACAYAEQAGGTNAEKLRHALEAARRLDDDDNAQRDFTDAQLRIAIEAHLGRKP